VLLDPAEALSTSGVRSYEWNGAFGSSYRIDPRNDLIAVMMIQAWGNQAIVSLRRDFRTAVTQAIVN
jgi:CubicO group peptidase (beta-lactamase class C family)